MVALAEAQRREREAPRLLLDTNVYLNLVGQRFASQGERMRAVSRRASQPLFWACGITFEELVGRIRPEDHADFVQPSVPT
jgi:hypothetical protein